MRTGRPPRITAELIRELVRRWERERKRKRDDECPASIPAPWIALALYGDDSSNSVGNVLKIMARANIQGDGGRFAYHYQDRGTQLTQRFSIEDLKKKWG